jgi:hypothetical protein
MTRRSLVVVALTSLACVASLSATTVLPITFEELVSEATTIVRGEVVDVRAEWRDHADGAEIVTKVTVRVQQILKGRPGTQLELAFLGGTIGDRTLAISDMPQFRVGERDFLFIDDVSRPASPLVGFFAGRLSIRVDALTHREFVTTFDGKPFSTLADFGSAPAQSLSSMGLSGPSVALSASEVEAHIRERVRR